ncbi:MAG: TonB-dependent receptor, partial [Thermoanaerobaculia bacterium]
MRMKSFWRHASIFALLVLLAGGAQAQLQTGNVYGEVADNQGQPLPGVTITLTGIGAPKIQITNAEGQYRFLGLSPGNYQLEAALEGFSTVEYPSVNIRVGRNTTINVTLSPAVEDVITVTSESPLLDERRLGPGTTVTSVELERIPTSRDPWSLLNQAPGVQVDRINVGGNESGQQSVFVGTGSHSNDNSFAVDGVVITDMSAIGASPTYYDFDAFEELQLSTGGTDISSTTGGVTVNLVTKRGTNEWRGSARFLSTDSGLQDSSGFSSGDLAPGQTSLQPNEIDEITDQGFEVGGFVIKDRLWVWGAYGEQDIVNLVAGGTRDATILENYNSKINAQISSSNSGLFQFSRGDKIKDGRGAGPQRPPETTRDQSGPTEIWKLEDTHNFNSNIYLTGLRTYVDGAFG